MQYLIYSISSGMQFSHADPWDFQNGDPVLLSPSGKERIEYEALNEIGMSAPLGGKAYLVKDHQKYLVDEICGGPARWDLTGNYVAIPVWLTGCFQRGMQRIAIIDTKRMKLVLYKRKFRLLYLRSFDEPVITATDSPIYKPEELRIDLSKEKVHQVIPLKAAK